MITNPIAANNPYVIDPAALQTLTLSLPAYDANPLGCAVGPYTYELVLTGGGAFPTWITQIPTTDI